MIYTTLTNEAMRIAYRAHHGQYDKNGIPYIYHPIHLAEQMQDEYTTCVALLHDVIEDTQVTADELSAIFPEPVMQAVLLLTHHPSEDYLEYVKRIRTNPIARTVKLADLRHNSDTSRIQKPDAAAIRRWEEKYKKALELLSQEESSND